MLYTFLYSLRDFHIFFNVFRYITFRTGLAMIFSFVIVVFFGPFLIRKLKELKIGEVIRDDGPARHKAKSGTPTMGGILMLGSILITTILWADLRNIYIWTILFITTSFGIVGLLDDILKLKAKQSSHKGMSATMKLSLLIIFAIAGIIMMVIFNGYDFRFWVPFFKNVHPEIGWFYVLVALLVVISSSNAVNLTDGLDGLAIVPVVVVAGTYTVFAYIAGRADYPQYLRIAYVPGAGEVCIFTGAMVGAGLGFLWFNSYPAEIFMGDVGSLSLGGGIGTVAVITKQELALIIVGGLFVMEALSVILQVGFYKWKKERIFLMAPLHHHFEQKGWAEPKIIVRFWIVQILLALMALSTLKLR